MSKLTFTDRHLSAFIRVTAFSLFLLTGTGRPVLASNSPNDDSQSLSNLVLQALEKNARQDFDGALALAVEVRHRFPNSPAAIFPLVAVYQITMETYRVRTYETQLDSLLGLAVDLAKTAIKKDKKNGRNYFYLGMVYGSRAALFSHSGEWLKAFRDGMKIKRNLLLAIAYSPQFFDPYYSLGVYNYWTSAKSKMLRVFADNRVEGIKQIKIAIEKAQFLRTTARYGLSAIYYNEKAYDAGLKLCEELYAEYPKNPTLSYRKGRILMEQEQWNAAKAAFEQLRSILNKATLQSLSYQMDCLYHLALCERELGNNEAAKALCETALELQEKCDFSKELSGFYQSHEDLRNWLRKLSKALESSEQAQSKT